MLSGLTVNETGTLKFATTARTLRFDWVAEVEVIDKATGKKKERDILANIDGNLVIAEVKLSDSFHRDQLEGYGYLCRRININYLFLIKETN